MSNEFDRSYDDVGRITTRRVTQARGKYRCANGHEWTDAPITANNEEYDGIIVIEHPKMLRGIYCARCIHELLDGYRVEPVEEPRNMIETIG